MKEYTPSDHTFAICAYKDSEFLEECVRSLIGQTVNSNIILCTSTPSDFIEGIANRYGIPVFVNNGIKGIGGDWNFALSKAATPLVTLAHQDDIYEPEYAAKMLENLNSARRPIIYFSGYAELRDGKKVYDNRILNTKKKLLSPLKIRMFAGSRFVRRRILSLGNAICCPAVTYVMTSVGNNPYTNDFKSNIDWQQWEVLSHIKGSFVYCDLPLMCHRVHSGSTTSAIISDDSRTDEDYRMYRKFWPRFIANILIKQYKKSQESNRI